MTSPTPTTATTPATDSQTSPTRGLRKMSTVAGVGHEYRAVNPLAITAAVAGLVSPAGLAVSLLLAIAGLGVIFGIVSLIQIRRSSGTQTGQIFALVGIFLSLGVITLATVNAVNRGRALAVQQAQVESLAETFGQRLAEGDYQAAYDLLGEGVQENVSLERFSALISGLAGADAFGPVQGARTNNIVRFEQGVGDAPDLAETVLIVEFENRPYRQQVVLARFGDPDDPVAGWRIANFELWFKLANPRGDAAAEQ